MYVSVITRRWHCCTKHNASQAQREVLYELSESVLLESNGVYKLLYTKLDIHSQRWWQEHTETQIPR